MKSFSIKTNNLQIIKYLLNSLENANIDNIYYSNKKFKIYTNIIIHYKGNNISQFNNYLCDLLIDTILKFYEEKLIKQMINFNYFYFDEFEQNCIFKNCLKIIRNDEYEPYDDGITGIYESILKYVTEHRTMILDGFVTFRLRKYIQYLDNIVDIAVNKFIIEKEYTEFVNLLKIYIDSKESDLKVLHLIYTGGESILLDEQKNIVSVSDNIFNARYLSDITFSSNDFALNTLLTLLPKRIEIHLIDEEDEFINTLKLIFEDRIHICTECNICRTYRLINNAKILN